jgi:hypothetical protein
MIFYRTQVKDTIIGIDATRPTRVLDNYIVKYKVLKQEYVSELLDGLVIIEKDRKPKLYEIIWFACDELFSTNLDYTYLLERITKNGN